MTYRQGIADNIYIEKDLTKLDVSERNVQTKDRKKGFIDSTYEPKYPNYQQQHPEIGLFNAPKVNND